MRKFILVFVSSTLLSASVLATDNNQARMDSSRNAVKELQGALVAELQAAMQAGGPVNAIDVCNTRAAAIAADISQKKGWKIGRTSLKLRNPINAPDAWEEKVLKDFEKRKAAGEDPTKLEHAEVVKQDGKQVFRYMKALPIPEGAPCLKCHGDKIEPAVAAKLKALYPNDQATGYKQGDLRGAVTITQPF